MTVTYEKRGHLVIVTLNRPDKLNAINEDMLTDLADAWQRFQYDDEAWLAILAAKGRAFCAGADKIWFERTLLGEDSLGRFLQGVKKNIYWSGEIDKPTIAAVDGMVVGAGFDLVLQADLRVAAETASFRFPEVDRGSVLVPWDNLPYAIAAEMIAGLPLTARRAYDLGIINRLTPPGGALDAALALADELLAKPPLALKRAMRILREIKNKNSVPSTPSLRDYTTDISRELSATEDWQESVNSLLSGAAPRYRCR